MPHDANGKLLNVGDTINVRCQVKEIHQTEEFCNVTLETNLPMFPTENLTTLVLNAKQVFKVENKKPITTSGSARRAAEEIREWIGISGLVDGEGINELAAIISKHFAAAAQPVVMAGRVVNISTHGEPARARLREIEMSVSHGYERECRELGWSKALRSALRDLHFLLTFFRDDAAAAAPADNDAELIQLLRQRRKYYDEEIFHPWTIEEGREVHAVFPNAVDRIAADSARHVIDVIISDVETGEHHATTKGDR